MCCEQISDFYWMEPLLISERRACYLASVTDICVQPRGMSHSTAWRGNKTKCGAVSPPHPARQACFILQSTKGCSLRERLCSIKGNTWLFSGLKINLVAQFLLLNNQPDLPESKHALHTLYFQLRPVSTLSGLLPWFLLQGANEAWCFSPLTILGI